MLTAIFGPDLDLWSSAPKKIGGSTPRLFAAHFIPVLCMPLAKRPLVTEEYIVHTVRALGGCFYSNHNVDPAMQIKADNFYGDRPGLRSSYKSTDAGIVQTVEIDNETEAQAILLWEIADASLHLFRLQRLQIRRGGGGGDFFAPPPLFRDG